MVVVEQIASFHLVRERPYGQWRALRRLLRDRRSIEGAEFVRVLGTGRDTSTGPSIDTRRTAVFAV